MNVLVSGSSGLIGTALRAALSARGHSVTRLVRSPPGAGALWWDPSTSAIDGDGVAAAGVDAVVHLAGKGIGSRRWNAAHKARVLDSRVRGTRLLSETIAKLPQPPRVMVSASAVGFYGDRGDEILTEGSPSGKGFLAEVVRQWEQSTEPAENAGIRVVHTRNGIVLSKRGGALPPLLLPFRLGLGGRVGSGTQYWPWITLEDEIGGILHCLENEALAGPVNFTAPNPVTNREFTRALGAALKRPAVIPVPAFVLRIVLGEMADEMLLASQRVVPRRLEDSGYSFAHLDVESGLGAVLAAS